MIYTRLGLVPASESKAGEYGQSPSVFSRFYCLIHFTRDFIYIPLIRALTI
jgi:hypothetical protein